MQETQRQNQKSDFGADKRFMQRGLGSKHQRGHYELVSCHHLPEDGRMTGGRSRNLLPACKDIRRAQMEPSSLHYASRRCFGASSGA